MQGRRRRRPMLRPVESLRPRRPLLPRAKKPTRSRIPGSTKSPSRRPWTATARRPGRGRSAVSLRALARARAVVFFVSKREPCPPPSGLSSLIQGSSTVLYRVRYTTELRKKALVAGKLALGGVGEARHAFFGPPPSRFPSTSRLGPASRRRGRHTALSRASETTSSLAARYLHAWVQGVAASAACRPGRSPSTSCPSFHFFSLVPFSPPAAPGGDAESGWGAGAEGRRRRARFFAEEEPAAPAPRRALFLSTCCP